MCLYYWFDHSWFLRYVAIRGRHFKDLLSILSKGSKPAPPPTLGGNERLLENSFGPFYVSTCKSQDPAPPTPPPPFATRWPNIWHWDQNYFVKNMCFFLTGKSRFWENIFTILFRSEKFKSLYSCVQSFEFIRSKKGCQNPFQKHELL